MIQYHSLTSLQIDDSFLIIFNFHYERLQVIVKVYVIDIFYLEIRIQRMGFNQKKHLSFEAAKEVFQILLIRVKNLL